MKTRQEGLQPDQQIAQAQIAGGNISRSPPVQRSAPSSPRPFARERAASSPVRQNVHNPQIQASPVASPRYYANMKQHSDSGESDMESAGNSAHPSSTRVAQVQKLLAAGIRPPPVLPDSPGRQRSSSGSSRDPVGLGLSYGSDLGSPDLSAFPIPGSFNPLPQSPNSNGFSRPHSPHSATMHRPHSPVRYYASRPQSPSRAPDSGIPSPARLERPQSPFSQPPPRPHSPTGYAPRHASPLSGFRSTPGSPRLPQGRMESPLYSPRGNGPRRMMNDLRVDTSRMPNPSATYRQNYSHQRQDTEYRRQMQNVQPPQHDEPMLNMSQEREHDSSTLTNTQWPGLRGRSPPRRQQGDAQDNLQSANQSLKAEGGIRKSRLAKPLPPPPPDDPEVPSASAQESDESGQHTQPDSPASTTSTPSPISPVSPMHNQGYGYALARKKSSELPSPVSAITTLDFDVLANAPAVPAIPKALARKPISNKPSLAALQSAAPSHTPPLSPPASKFQVRVGSPHRRMSGQSTESPVEDSSTDELESPKSPRLSESPVRFEKARSIQIQTLDKPGDTERSSRNVSSVGERAEGHRRVPSMVPSLIDLKSPTTLGRPEVIKEEASPERRIATASTQQASTVRGTAGVEKSALVVAEQGQGETVRTDHPTDTSSETQHARFPQTTAATLDHSTGPALRSKSSRAKDLISKIEQKVQSDHSRAEISSVGRKTPSDQSPAPSIKSLKTVASKENMLAPRMQATSSVEQLVARPEEQTHTAKPNMPTPRVMTSSSPTHGLPTVPIADANPTELPKQERDAVATQAHEPALLPSERVKVQDPELVSAMNTAEVERSGAHSTPHADTLVRSPKPVAMTESPRQESPRLPNQSDGSPAPTQRPHALLQKQDASNIPVASTTSQTTVTQVSQSPAEIPRTLAETAPTLTKQGSIASISSSKKSIGAEKPAHQFVVVKGKQAAAPSTANVTVKPGDVPSYKSFFSQDDIFFVEPEFPTYPNGILPSIQEDGAHDEVEKRKSSSTNRSVAVPAKITARQMARAETRPPSKGKPVQSSASSIASSQKSEHDGRSGSSRDVSLPVPHIAPFAHEDRPSSADTGVLPANENIKISALSYEAELAAQAVRDEAPTQAHEAPNDLQPAQNAAEQLQVERRAIARPNPSAQARPTSEAPPPVPRKDTIKRPRPKRSQKSDDSAADTLPSVAERQRTHISPDLTRIEANGSVSSINLDAIRARVAGMSERTAKAIEAPGKDESSLLATLEDLAKQSEMLHERYTALRADRQKISNNMSTYLRDVDPGPGYVAALMDQNAALAAVMSSMDICFAKLKSLDCRKEEAIAALMANIHRKPSSASRASTVARVRGMSGGQTAASQLTRGGPTTTVVHDESRPDHTREAQGSLPIQRKEVLSVQREVHQPTPLSMSTSPRPIQSLNQQQSESRGAPAADVALMQSQQHTSPDDPPSRSRVKGAKAVKVLGLLDKQGQVTDKAITLPDPADQDEHAARLVVKIGPLKQAKTPPPSRPLPTPPERRRSIVDSVHQHQSIQSLGSTPDDPDLWTPHEDNVAPNALKTKPPPARDVRVYADDDLLDYYRTAA